MHLLDELAYRNLIYQQTNADGLREHLSAPRVVYAGFDPTASSLTVGHLVPLLSLARFQRAGHRPIAVMGGGTGLIGDPSFKSSERPVLSAEQVQANIDQQRPVFERLLDFSGAHAAKIQDNAEWLTKLGFIEALRDIGKHFSVNMMLQKDSVRERLENREQGISYTEFSYMLLQAYDFQALFDREAVTLQLAGSDQWGNVVAGVDLIRRTRRAEVFGLTAPLVTKADGTKFGKTESGAVWLNADKTSPYNFYQFLLNAADSDVLKYLKIFTFFTPEEIDELAAAHAGNPGARTAHQALAAHVTELVHGPSAVAQAKAATQALFSGDLSGLSRDALLEVFENTPSASLDKGLLAGEGLAVVDLLIQAQVVKSKREARELLSSNAILLNGQQSAPDDRLRTEALLYGELAAVRRGKKTWHVVRFT